MGTRALKKFEAHQCRSDASNLGWMLNHVWIHTWNWKERELKLLPGYWSDSKIVQNLSKDTQWLFVKAWWDLNSAIWRRNSVSINPSNEIRFMVLRQFCPKIRLNPSRCYVFRSEYNLESDGEPSDRTWKPQELHFAPNAKFVTDAKSKFLGSIFVSNRWFEPTHDVSSI